MSLAPVIGARSEPIIVDQLYQEAIGLADESRTYFTNHSKTDRAALGPIDRVLYTAESLRVSTRLMHVISWLMVRKAVANGEMSAEDAMAPSRQLGDMELCQRSDPRDLRRLPRSVVQLSYKSLDIHQRAIRLQSTLQSAADEGDSASNPVGKMLQDLELAI